MKKYKYPLYLFILLAVIYAALVVTLPDNSNTLDRYHISGTQARFLSLTVAAPLIVIWFIAYYGYNKFKQYALSVKKSKEGKGFSILANGLLILALWMPVAGIMGNLSSRVGQDADSLLAMTILTNYLNILLLLTAFLIVYRGAQHLKKILDGYQRKPSSSNFLPEIFVLASGLFVYLTLVNPSREHPVGEAIRATYYLPDWLIVLTIIIPYLVIWYLGFRAASIVYSFSKNIPGIIYSNSLKYVARGFGFIVASLIAIRYLVSMTPFFNSLTLKLILALVYLLLVLIATGYVLIALGARKLRKIEEI